MKRLWIAGILGVAAVVAVGCESSSKPTSPSLVAPAPPQTFTLSGMVTEVSGTGVVPVSGALVQETRSQRRATSDGDGHYSISGVSDSGSIRISKDGYVSSTSSLDIPAHAHAGCPSHAHPDLHPLGGGLRDDGIWKTSRRGRGSSTVIPVEPEAHIHDQRRARALPVRVVVPRWSYPPGNGKRLLFSVGSYSSSMEYVSATVGGDTQFDIEVARR